MIKLIINLIPFLYLLFQEFSADRVEARERKKQHELDSKAFADLVSRTLTKFRKQLVEDTLRSNEIDDQMDLEDYINGDLHDNTGVRTVKDMGKIDSSSPENKKSEPPT